MNTPINHHYVSQCQIGNFFNKKEGKIYLYDKILNNHFFRKSTKRVFSEDKLNTRFEFNRLDHSTLEKDLKDNYEDYFNKYYRILTKIIDTKVIPLDLCDALAGLTKYGIAGEIRTPYRKKETDELINKFLFNFVLPNAAPELKQDIEKLKFISDQTKYSNTIQYSEFAETVFTSMGGINCILYVIESEDFFLLPDRSSITKREKINEYFNPDIKEIAMVGVPLSSKIYLHSESNKLQEFKNRFIIQKNTDVKTIERINLSLYLNANKMIACENEQYLKNFVININEL